MESSKMFSALIYREDWVEKETEEEEGGNE